MRGTATLVVEPFEPLANEARTVLTERAEPARPTARRRRRLRVRRSIPRGVTWRVGPDHLRNRPVAVSLPPAGKGHPSVYDCGQSSTGLAHRPLWPILHGMLRTYPQTHIGPRGPARRSTEEGVMTVTTVGPDGEGDADHRRKHGNRGGLRAGVRGRGARVAICARGREAGEAWASELTARGPGECRFEPCDVTRAEDIENAIERTVEQYGRTRLLDQQRWLAPRPPPH